MSALVFCNLLILGVAVGLAVWAISIGIDKLLGD